MKADDIPAGNAPGSKMQALSRLAPGISIALVVGLAANFLGTHYGAPVMLFALLLGLALNFLSDDQKIQPGLEFAAKTVLRVGIALLGLRIAFSDITGLGWQPLSLIIVGTISTILAGVLFARLTGTDKQFGVLTSGAVAICGASAAMAISAILPDNKNNERDTAFTVIAVTTLSTIAMIAYPVVADFLDLSDVEAGLFIGATIHDVAQVVGAGFSISDEAGNMATVAKLIRVAMLVPIVLALAMFFRSKRATSTQSYPPFLPPFLILFILLVGVNSFDLLPQLVTSSLSDFSRLCLTTAIAAVGIKTHPNEMIAVGWKPVVLTCLQTLWLAGLILYVLSYMTL